MRSIPVTALEAVKRAFKIVANPSTYILGAGGRNPQAETPFTVRDGKLGADCIGFVLWAWGLDRFQKDYPFYGGWINTDSMLMDLKKDRKWFAPAGKPFPGCAVVYGSIWRNGKMVRMGHIGLVTKVPENWPDNFSKLSLKDRKAWMLKVEVIDCAAALPRKILGKAVARRTGLIWATDGYFVKFVHQP